MGRCLFFPAACALALASCTVKPFVMDSPKGTSIASLGGSLMTKSKEEFASLKRADGTEMTSYIVGKDETIVPNAYIGYKTITGLADAANTGEKIRETNTTKRAASSDSVRKAEIDSNTTIRTFVPPIQ